MKNWLKYLCYFVLMTIFIPSIVLSSTKKTPVKEATFVLLNETGEKIRSSSIMTITDPTSKIILDKSITGCEVIEGLAKVEFTDQGVLIHRKDDDKGAIVVEAVRNISLPFQMNLSYELNGTNTDWKNIIGQRGIVKFTVHFQSVSLSREDRLPFTIQATVPLNTKQIQLLDPGQADVLVIGTRTNLVYANLLLNSLNWEWEAYSDEWAMDSWDLTLLPKYPNLDMEAYLSLIDLPIQALMKINDGYRQIREGVQEVNQNQSLLLNGYRKIDDGWKQWIAGFQELTDGLPSLKQGFDEYRNGVKLIQSGIKDQQASIDEELEKWKSFQSKLSQAQTGFSLFSSRLTMLKAKHDRLIETSASLSNDIASQTELANQILQTAEKDSPAYQLAVSIKENQLQIDEIHSMLLDESKEIAFIQSFWDTFQKTFTEQYVPMIEEASVQINHFVSGMNSLVSGLQELNNGLNEGQNGVIQMQEGASMLQKNAGSLLSPSNLLHSNSEKLQRGSEDIYQNLLLIERTGTSKLITELVKAQSDFKETLRLKNQAESMFKKSETPFYIVKINFPNQHQTIFEIFQEKLRLHYNK